MDDVRTAEGGEGVTGVMIRARIWVDGRLAGGLQALLGAPMAAYSGCGEPDGGIGHGRTGLARVCGDVGLAGGSVADGLRQAGSGSQSGQGAAELLLPGPALGKMQGQSACRAGDPSGQGKDPSSEGLGGHDLDPGRCGLSSGPGCAPSPVPPARRRWRRKGEMVSPTPYLRSRIAFSISA